MTLALMIANPPPRGEKAKCTLIVCSPGLLAQCKSHWVTPRIKLNLHCQGEREIEKHKDPEYLKVVLRHCSATRISGRGGVHVMQNADIV